MQVTIEGQEARARSPEGKTAKVPLTDLLTFLAPRRLSTQGIVLPDGVKALVELPGGRLVVVHETPLNVWNLRWVAKDSPSKAGGPGTQYRNVRVALPYVVVLAQFHVTPRGALRLAGSNECFFRNAPLKSLDDELCYPALLNCSRFEPQEGRPLSWICTQHLHVEPNGHSAQEALTLFLTELLRHLLQGGFNYSSEEHEFSSWYSEHVKAGVDPRISTIEAWEEATQQDPTFVLEIPWLPTGMSVRQVAERIGGLDSGSHSGPATADDVARLVFRGERLLKKRAEKRMADDDAPGQTTLYPH